MNRIAYLFGLLVLLVVPALGQPIVVDGDHNDRVFSGQGRDFLIQGHHNDVIINGEVGTVTVDGHHNDVYLDHPSVIEMNGHHNDIYFKSGNPRVIRRGAYNEIVRSGGGAVNVEGAVVEPDGGDEGADAIVINGAAGRREFEGNHRNFVINGASNDILIRGKAGSVTVNGSSNLVTVEEADVITVTGVQNDVVYQRGNPHMTRTGVGNSITKK